MTINELVQMAEYISEKENLQVVLADPDNREGQNAYWAKVIGCAYWGHSEYNEHPDTQWHLKNAGGGRPQSNDVAVSMPSRTFYDCINGIGSPGYSFNYDPHAEGPLPNEQEVYAPPKPEDSGEVPEPGPSPTPEPTPVIPYDENFSIRFGHGCNDVYKESGADVDAGMISVHSQRCAWDYYVGGLTQDESYNKHINEFRAVYSLPPV